MPQENQMLHFETKDDFHFFRNWSTILKSSSNKLQSKRKIIRNEKIIR